MGATVQACESALKVKMVKKDAATHPGESFTQKATTIYTLYLDRLWLLKNCIKKFISFIKD